MNILPINLTGSLQNPAWAPSGEQLVITRFREQYNTGASDIIVVNSDGSPARVVDTDNSQNVNAPGSTWIGSHITWSSDTGEHDEIYVNEPVGIRQITNRPNNLAWEPSFSPTGEFIVFESHNLSGIDGGELWYVNSTNMGNPIQLTSGHDDRQPNWSPDGSAIVFQSKRTGSWQLWLFEFGLSSSTVTQITNEPYECTDATWHPDGKHVLFSRDAGLAVIDTTRSMPIIAVPGIDSGWYAGAPSWSPDGKMIAFETCQGDPDGSPGTKIATVAFSL